MEVLPNYLMIYFMKISCKWVSLMGVLIIARCFDHEQSEDILDT